MMVCDSIASRPFGDKAYTRKKLAPKGEDGCGGPSTPYPEVRSRTSGPAPARAVFVSPPPHPEAVNPFSFKSFRQAATALELWSALLPGVTSGSVSSASADSSEPADRTAVPAITRRV